jgi:hypothetical protein
MAKISYPNEEEAQKFFAALGEVICYWTQIERALKSINQQYAHRVPSCLYPAMKLCCG